VADGGLPLDHRSRDSEAAAEAAVSSASRSEATLIDRCPRSRARRAMSDTDLAPFWSAAHFRTIGRLTPVTISTRSFFRKERVRFVGVHPNISVRMTAPSPVFASDSPAAMHKRTLW